jgi:hypothetical protein
MSTDMHVPGYISVLNLTSLKLHTAFCMRIDLENGSSLYKLNEAWGIG